MHRFLISVAVFSFFAHEVVAGQQGRPFSLHSGNKDPPMPVSRDLRPRNTSQDSILVNDMPPCVKKNCPDQNGDLYSPLGDCATDRTQVSRDCLCKLQNPLKCTSFCDGLVGSWLRTEDWLNKTCPKHNYSIDFTKVPECSRKCIKDAAFDAGCMTWGEDCFCFQGDTFECEDLCSSQDKDKTLAWRNETCRAYIGFVIGGSGSAPSPKKKRLRKYEISSIVFGGASGIILLISLLLELGLLDTWNEIHENRAEDKKGSGPNSDGAILEKGPHSSVTGPLS